ncbi:MAG: rod shape-determining protein MreC [Spiribacter sp.]|nr:rod shape-determining protein MreC [Spiribacter sp.]
MKPLFLQGPSLTARLILLLLISVALMTVDHRQGLLEPVRQVISTAVHPIRLVASLPTTLLDTASTQLTSRRELLAENARLQEKQTRVEARLQRLDALEAENIRLRTLLDSSYDLERPVLIADLIEVDLDPFSHLIEIDKGLQDDVYVGQPVIDGNGVIGQVDRIAPLSATVRLISDPSHGLPVQVNRNGLRSVAFGTGRLDTLTIRSLPNNADIRADDLIVTSGLGGRFPSGYPVARVKSAQTDPGEPFSRIELEPLGALDRIQEVLLIEREQTPEGTADE